MSKTKLLTLLFILFFINVKSFSQKQYTPMKFGRVPPEDLLVPTYAPDSTADAVVLGDYGNITVGRYEYGFTVDFLKHRRVKILKKSAFEREGNIVFQYVPGYYTQKLNTIRAYVAHPSGEKKMFGASDFVDEKKNDYLIIKKLAIPNLEEGSVIDFEYEILTRDIFNLHDWYFQDDIPVRRSDLDLGISQDYEYVVTKRGLPLAKEDTIYNGRNVTYNGSPTAAYYYHYYMDTVKAFKAENFMTTSKDYTNKLKFQLTKRQTFIWQDSFFTNWKKVVEDLYKYPGIGEQFTKRENYSSIWKKMKPLVEKTTDYEEKVKIIYNFINENVTWDEYLAIAADQPLNDAFKKKKASAAEINLMMLACMQEAGVSAHPCLVSTVDHGKPIVDYPVMSQFNLLMCYVEANNKAFFVDGGNVKRAYNQPRLIALNEKAFIVDKNNPRWVDIPKATSSEIVSATFKLSEEGKMEGSFSASFNGYTGLEERMSYEKDKNNENVKKHWESQLPDIVIDSIVVKNQEDPNLPFKRDVVCSINNAVIVADDLMYIKPTLRTKYDENPFKVDKREYPIDFPSQVKDYFVLNLTVPDGYEVEELPKSTVIKLGEDWARFIYSATNQGNKIQLSIKVLLNEIHYETENYEAIKSFYGKIAAKCNEQIVLRKKKS